MKKKTLLVATGALLLLSGAGAAWAAMGHGPHHLKMMEHMIQNRIEDAEDYVDATPQQRQVIDGAKQEIFAAFEARAQAKAQHPGHLIDLLAADKLDTNALYALADERAQDIRDLAKVVVPQIEKIHDALTPAQRQKLADKARRRHAQWQEEQ